MVKKAARHYLLNRMIRKEMNDNAKKTPINDMKDYNKTGRL